MSYVMYVYVVMYCEDDYESETSVYAVCLDSKKANEIIEQAQQELPDYLFWVTPPILVEKS